LSEAATPALVSPRHLELVRLARPVPSVDGEAEPAGDPIRVTNPLSHDHSLLRQTLVASLLDVVATNQRHGTDDIAVFEIGKGYAKDGAASKEWWRLGFALTGAAEPPHHARRSRPYDLDDAKGVIDLLCRRIGYPRPVYEREADEAVFHPGRTARVQADARVHGIVGELHPRIAEAWELRGDRVIVAELAVSGLSGARLTPEHVPQISRFPAVERDLAIVVPPGTSAGAIDAAIRSAAGALLLDVRLFDVYRGEPLAADERSLAYRLTFQASDRTLTEDEVGEAIEAVIGAVGGHGGRIRT
jgi:phenylalanyl-tRNA synthetase beta chain